MTIEKWQGCKSPDYTTEEAAMLTAARRVKQQNPDAAVLVWYAARRSRRLHLGKASRPLVPSDGQTWGLSSPVGTHTATRPKAPYVARLTRP